MTMTTVWSLNVALNDPPPPHHCCSPLFSLMLLISSIIAPRRSLLHEFDDIRPLDVQNIWSRASFQLGPYCTLLSIRHIIAYPQIHPSPLLINTNHQQ